MQEKLAHKYEERNRGHDEAVSRGPGDITSELNAGLENKSNDQRQHAQSNSNPYTTHQDYKHTDKHYNA